MSLLTTKPRKPKRDPTLLHLALGVMIGGTIFAIVFWAAL